MAAGARYVVFTAKHHDGFCLWPTRTTDYSVASSPWQNGDGDVVGDLADACREAGIGLGLYLSPWDRNAACYDAPEAYDAFYIRQLIELCTRYGPLCEVWFDGAGSEGRTYDWEAIMTVVERHQPDAMVFNMGRPTIRWVGKEDGLAKDPCWYVTDSTGISIYDDGQVSLDSLRYLPPECDVPIRQNWFWQPDDAYTLKSRDHLLAIWYRSVGLGAGLLLNVPPDRRGLIDELDHARLLEFSAELTRRFGRPYSAELVTLPEADVIAHFPESVLFDHVELREDLSSGQRITSHTVLAGDRVLAAGSTVGVRRVHAFEPVTATELKIHISGDGAALSAVRVFRTGNSEVPGVEKLPDVMNEKSADH